jgi:hypothetical protein
VTAPFAADLCGYRKKSGNPSTSDSHDKGSVEWGHALFEMLQVPASALELTDIGNAVEHAVISHLKPTRPDLTIERSRPAIDFDQYRHLGVSAKFAKESTGDLAALEQAAELAALLPRGRDRQALIQKIRKSMRLATEDDSRVQELIRMLPEESLLKLDIAITAPSTGERLLLGVSSKWSLRTDRAQDCIAQGGKLVNLRRGQMPHYAVLTMEPRPSMLRLLAYGSGSLDCVYHLALDELMNAARTLATKRNNPVWPPLMLLERMVAQGRVRPYQALVDEVVRLPA